MQPVQHEQSNLVKPIKIEQVQPSMSGFYLIFEINEIKSRQQNPQVMHCRIVDDTGIINAFFNQYTKYLKVGSVYRAGPLKTKVVDFHLQIELMLNTTIEKEPFIMGFKDKENDLSVKYYALKEEVLKVQNKHIIDPKIEGNKLNKQSKTVLNGVEEVRSPRGKKIMYEQKKSDRVESRRM